MIKFIPKKHIDSRKEPGTIIIYYSISDILLGTALLVLVVFFIQDYLSHAVEDLNRKSPLINEASEIEQKQ